MQPLGRNTIQFSPSTETIHDQTIHGEAFNGGVSYISRLEKVMVEFHAVE